MINILRQIELHRLFWKRENRNPLFGFSHSGNFNAAGYDIFHDDPLDICRIESELLDLYQGDYSFVSVNKETPEDFIYSIIPDCGISWYEAIIGCSLRFSKGSKMTWAEKFACDLDVLGRKWKLPLEMSNEWVVLLEKILTKQQLINPDKPVSPVLARGLTDILYAAVPEDEILIELRLQPMQFAPYFEELSKMIIQIFDIQLGIIRPILGGYVFRRGLWAPGSICMTQEDGSSLLSPQIFEEYILPYQRKIWSRFDFSLFHVHSISLKLMIEGLIKSDELTCIECMIDPNGPPIDNLLPDLHRLQQAGKCILISSYLLPHEIEILCNHLMPQGLAFLISADEPQDYRQLLNSIKTSSFIS